MSPLDRYAEADRRLILGLTALELEHDRRVPANSGWPSIARPDQLTPEGDW